jgi:Flp pilus assembly protein TadG
MAITIAPQPGHAPIGSSHRSASRGQVLIMFALFSTAMLGMIGLATDLGIAFAGRRSMQNAADAGALAGARAIARRAAGASISVPNEVAAMVSGNTSPLAQPALEQCVFLNDSGSSLGPCAATIPPGATGVRVTVSETHQTFFIRVVPGAPKQVTTRATASAHVRKVASIPSDGPFLVCGVATELASGGQMAVMVKKNGTWQINPDAVGKTFKIHGPQIQKCKAKASRYKGVVDQGANRAKSAPPEQWFNYKEGDTAGPVSADVQGAQGCKAGQVVVNCVAFLPIVVDTPEEPGNSRQLWCVGFAPFYITEPKSNEHNGTLIGAYIVKGPVTGGWTPDYLGPVVIKLTS